MEDRLPPQATLQELMTLHDDGSLTWNRRLQDWFPTVRALNTWNTRYAGKSALNYKDQRGYFKGRLFNKEIFAHRAIFKMVHGYEPPHIDHINGKKADNRPVNLREVTHAENCKNSPITKQNTSGVRGVSFHTRYSKWVASIHSNGQDYHLGSFDKFEDAVAARKAGEAKHGFHPNHGRPSHLPTGAKPL